MTTDNKQLTQELLKESVHYNPNTGVFTWLESCRGRRMNKPAGGIKPDGYVKIGINYKRYFAHRLAWLYMTGNWPTQEIDHIDHNPTNNIFSNLREVTSSENSKNCNNRSNNNSGVVGVHWTNRRKKWIASIFSNGKIDYGGQFDNYFDAVCCRKSLENKHNFHTNHGAAK